MRHVVPQHAFVYSNDRNYTEVVPSPFLIFSYGPGSEAMPF